MATRKSLVKKEPKHKHFWTPIAGHDETGSLLKCDGCGHWTFVNLEDYNLVMKQQKNKKRVVLIDAVTRKEI